MKYLKYTGIADNRIIEHEQVGSLLFTSGEVKEVDDHIPGALATLCPGEFVEVEAPAELETPAEVEAPAPIADQADQLQLETPAEGDEAPAAPEPKGKKGK